MRQQTCTTVTLRQRPIRNGRISLYLDYYPAVRNPKTMQLSRREYLGFYIYATPKNAVRKIINGISFICTLRNLSMANVCLEKSLLTYVTASEIIFSMQGN